jgi:ribosome biogenesis GTPase
MFELGFDERFHVVDPSELAEHSIARIISVHKNRYVVSNGNDEVFAEISGKLFANANTIFDYPAAGDYVLVNFHNSETFAIIHSILPRKSLLKRKTPGRNVDFQLIASNIDTALVIQSIVGDFNIRRLERYLVMINEADIHPVVLLSKSDLAGTEEIKQKVAAIHDIFPQLQVEAFSNKGESDLQTIKHLLISGKTYCLLGSSGVGKTTLLNRFIGNEVYKTLEIREKDGRGRHATTSRQLIKLESGAIIIDTPGMRELGNFDVDEGLDETFSDITALSEECRFKDCTHTHEKGCAVQAAIESGLLSEERFQNYVKLNKEAAYNAMSYLDKRRKDKQFGKMCKEVLKRKKFT